MKKTDPSFILNITPNFIYGRRQGHTDEETKEIASNTFEEMQSLFEEKEGMTVEYDTEMMENGYEFEKPICPKCSQRRLYRRQRYCDRCGVRIKWEDK